jgi:hypothetical protein
LTDAIYNFFRQVALTLALYGECVYEIVELVEPKKNDVQAFDLSFIQPGTMTQRGSGTWVQRIPESVAAEREIEKYISLSSERLLFFHFHEPFHDNWMKMMRRLAQLSDLTPDFAFENASKKKGRTPFDFSKYFHSRDQTVAMLTSQIGWNMRKYPHDGMLEYYWFHRRLKFELFKIRLRESLLGTLNDGIRRIGSKLNMKGKIVIEGVSTQADVVHAQEDLITGRCHASEILERFSPV